MDVLGIDRSEVVRMIDSLEIEAATDKVLVRLSPTEQETLARLARKALDDQA